MSPNGNCASPYDFARGLLIRRGAEDRSGEDMPGETVRAFVRAEAHSRLWDSLPAVAEHHGVAPLLAPMLTTADETPQDCRRTLAALASRHRRMSAVREQCIDELLAACAQAGVPIVLLKGAALAHMIYANPSLRPMIDIDVLVGADDLRRVVPVARALGFTFAPRDKSRFVGPKHHLPAASMPRSGFGISLEIHRDALSSEYADRLTLATLVDKPRSFKRGDGPEGLAFGHIDMLRHLTRHAFLPARQVRLIHLYDLWRYQTKYRDQIDWEQLAARFPDVTVKLRLAALVFADPDAPATGREPMPAGIGHGMVPLAEIAAAASGPRAKLAALFNPPAWWMHGFYGIAPENSLLACRCIRHPLTLGRWMAQRLAPGLGSPRQDAELGEADADGHALETRP